MVNFFELYQIPVSFYPDEAALRKIYYANSKRFHPDFFSLADEEKKEWAMEQSTLNNLAFATLSDFDRRMRHILELKGVLGGDETQQPALPPAFLMEMMDINEAIMDLQMDFDEQRWKNTLEQVAQLEKGLYDSVEPQLKNYQDNGEKEDMLFSIKDFFLKKKYLLRIKENLSTFASA